MSFYPPISRGSCWILWYVRWASLFISMAYSADEESLGSIDLSKATGLKDMVFSWKWNPQWVIMTLRTITHNHRNLQRISLETPWNICPQHTDKGNPTNPRDPTGGDRRSRVFGARWSSCPAPGITLDPLEVCVHCTPRGRQNRNGMLGGELVATGNGERDG